MTSQDAHLITDKAAQTALEYYEAALFALIDFTAEAELREKHMLEEIEAALPTFLLDSWKEHRKRIADRRARLEKDKDETASILKSAIVEAGKTFTGHLCRGVYVPAYASYDSRKLDAYSETHPEIQRFRQMGRPSARLERIK